MAKRFDRFAGRGIERIHKVQNANEDAPVVSIAPIGKAPVGLCAANAGIKLPEKFSRGSVQSKYFLCGSDAIQDAVDYDGVGLQAAFFAGIKSPGNPQIIDVAAVDLREGRVVGAGRGTTVDGPVAVFLGEERVGEKEEEQTSPREADRRGIPHSADSVRNDGYGAYGTAEEAAEKVLWHSHS